MDLDIYDKLFIGFAFFLQAILIIHFALRRRRFDLTLRYGWIVYALSIPAAALSIMFILGGKSWQLWVAGFLYLIWAIFGYTVEFVKKITWREPFIKSVGIPYVFLYLTTIMFYWWPLGNLYKPLWYGYLVLFLVSTFLNITSHKVSQPDKSTPQPY